MTWNTFLFAMNVKRKRNSPRKRCDNSIPSIHFYSMVFVMSQPLLFTHCHNITTHETKNNRWIKIWITLTRILTKYHRVFVSHTLTKLDMTFYFARFETRIRKTIEEVRFGSKNRTSSVYQNKTPQFFEFLFGISETSLYELFRWQCTTISSP